MQTFEFLCNSYGLLYYAQGIYTNSRDMKIRLYYKLTQKNECKNYKEKINRLSDETGLLVLMKNHTQKIDICFTIYQQK